MRRATINSQRALPFSLRFRFIYFAPKTFAPKEWVIKNIYQNSTRLSFRAEMSCIKLGVLVTGLTSLLASFVCLKVSWSAVKNSFNYFGVTVFYKHYTCYKSSPFHFLCFVAPIPVLFWLIGLLLISQCFVLLLSDKWNRLMSFLLSLKWRQTERMNSQEVKQNCNLLSYQYYILTTWIHC